MWYYDERRKKGCFKETVKYQGVTNIDKTVITINCKERLLTNAERKEIIDS